MPEALNEVIKILNKKYGNESILTVGEKGQLEIETISTNCYSLDRIFSCGGLPRGRIIEIFGAESSGKSTLAMYIIAQVQKWGGKAVLVDAEFAFNQDYAAKIGVDTEKLLLSQPNTGEEGLDIVLKMVNTGDVDIIVVDSVAALVPSAELAGEIFDVNIALQARMMSKFLRMITGTVSKTKTVIIFINQIRDKIGIFVGNKVTTTGGHALKFYASVRLEVKTIGKIKNKEGDVVGNKLKVYAAKNKVGLPFRTAEIDLYFEKGIDVFGDLVEVASEEGILEKSGNTYSWNGEKLGVGKDAARDYLEGHPEAFEQIRSKLNP